ncbi:MAG: YaiO family outer membrane beta-barrel protein [Terriglobales bacterium]
MSTSFCARLILVSLLLLTATGLAWQATKPTLAEGIRLKREQKLAAAADIFHAILKDAPQNVEAMVQLATVEGWQNHFDQSLQWWEKAYAAKPDDADIGVGMARIQYWKGTNAAAVGTLERVLAQHPEYLDALLLMGDVQMASNSPGEARSYYLRAQKVDAAAPGLAKKLENASAPLRWRFDTGISADDYNQGRGQGEHSFFAQLGYKAHARANVWVRHDQYNYFNQIDNSVSLGTILLVAEPLAVTTEVSIIPRAEFQPDWKFHVNGDYIVHPQVTLSGMYRRWKYPQGAVHMFAPGVRWQALPWLAAGGRYTVSRNIDKSVTGAWQTQFEFQVDDEVQLYAGYARGEENIPPQARAKFQAYSTGAIWHPHRRLGLRLDYSFERRPKFWDRHSIGPGVRVSF